MTAAIPVTTKRFGPSGSWKNANIILEHATAVIARISKELFLKLICIDALRETGGSVFAAVGYAHMVGDRGLPGLLGQMGYRVEFVVFAKGA